MKQKNQRIRKTKREQLQQIIADYTHEHGDVPWDHHDVARWAISKERWKKSPMSLERMCARELSQAAREEYYTDPQGRRARAKHACRIGNADGTQTYLWADIRTAQPDHMRMSLQQRRMSTVGDLKQLKTDQESYNDNNVHGARIQLSFDFTEDLAELEHPTDYPDAPESSD